MESNNKMLYIIGGVMILIALVIGCKFVLKGNALLDKTNLEYELIKQGKSTSDSEIIRKFAEELHSGNISKAKEYLANDCVIYDENSNKCSFEEYMSKIDTSTSYKYEKRGNSIKDEATYKISWNDGTEIQTIIMKKVVSKERVYYEIVECVLTINRS